MLLGAVKIRHERDVDIKRVLASDLKSDLAYRLKERLALDIARRSADLRDNDVRLTCPSDVVYEILDLVCNMRDHLNGLAEVLSAALLLYDVRVGASRGEV